jgi:hypothetical protein
VYLIELIYKNFLLQLGELKLEISCELRFEWYGSVRYLFCNQVVFLFSGGNPSQQESNVWHSWRFESERQNVKLFLRES